jgi:hypothetical protein
MRFRQWDIVTTKVWGTEHPVVVLTPDPMQFKEYLSLLACSSRRATREPWPYEVILDEADGLDWPTVCKLAPILAIKPDEIESRRGQVVPERRREIGEKMVRLFGLFAG